MLDRRGMTVYPPSPVTVCWEGGGLILGFASYGQYLQNTHALRLCPSLHPSPAQQCLTPFLWLTFPSARLKSFTPLCVCLCECVCVCSRTPGAESRLWLLSSETHLRPPLPPPPTHTTLTAPSRTITHWAQRSWPCLTPRHCHHYL